MNKFESELKKGNFMISECEKCSKPIWPPSEYCDKCFSSSKWRNIEKTGTLIEFSKKNDVLFGIVELEQIRVLGTLNIPENSLKPGKHVKLDSCYFDDKPKFTFVSY